MTLPIELVKELGWKEKQKVGSKKDEGRTLVISDWKK